MADRRPQNQKPKGSGNPNRINRLLVKQVETNYSKLTNMVVLTNLAMSSEQSMEIRSTLRGQKTRMRMIRNRLSLLAFRNLGLKEAEKLFLGPTCVVDSDDPVLAAKVAVELVTKFNKSLKLAGGVLEGKVLGADEIKVLARSKSRKELIADVSGMAIGPGGRIGAALKGPGGRVAGALKALVEKLEKAAAAPQEAAKPA